VKYVKPLAITWALIYFITGALKSFTLNSLDFWASIGLLFFLFLLPLPIAIIGFWFERAAGFLLLLCGLGSLVSGVVAALTRASASPSERGTFLLFIAMWTIPHAVFGLAYILPRRTKICGLR